MLNCCCAGQWKEVPPELAPRAEANTLPPEFKAISPDGKSIPVGMDPGTFSSPLGVRDPGRPHADQQLAQIRIDVGLAMVHAGCLHSHDSDGRTSCKAKYKYTHRNDLGVSVVGHCSMTFTDSLQAVYLQLQACGPQSREGICQASMHTNLRLARSDTANWDAYYIIFALLSLCEGWKIQHAEGLLESWESCCE